MSCWQIQLLEHNPETDSVKVLASYVHGQEVWHLAPHPHNLQVLATIGNQGSLAHLTPTAWQVMLQIASLTGGTFTAAVWSINSKEQLEKTAELKTGSSVPRSVLWHKQRAKEAVVIEDGRWRLWSIDAVANVR